MSKTISLSMHESLPFPVKYYQEEGRSMCTVRQEDLEELYKVYRLTSGFWFNKETHPPKREAGKKILAYGGYIFEAECNEDGDWCSIGGDDFTHWLPYFEPTRHT